jgi:hypothetical protein
VSAFQLHLWREWREHRFAILSLGIVLPLGAWMLARQLSQGTVADPLFHGAVALVFAVVMLVVVGGELLGAERRGPGLRWLERLPGGLAGAFRAKLAFFVLSSALAASWGYGTGWTIAELRDARYAGAEPSLGLLVALVLVLGTWTFAVSTWALRGGLSLLAAALVLAVIGFPAWRVIDAGYEPAERELEVALALLVVGGLLGASLGFVRGTRLGRGTLASALLGLAPAVALAGVSGAWSAMRMTERAYFDPLSSSASIEGSLVTADGRVAFATLRQEIPRWNNERLPRHVLRLDLERGTHEVLGHGMEVRQRVLTRDGDRGLPEPDELMITIDAERPLVFDPHDGAGRPWDPERERGRGWNSEGLGVRYARLKPTDRDVIRDPFRGRDYPTAHFADLVTNGRLLVRPGRWLHSGNSLSWTWFDPDSGEREPVDWPEQSQPLVLFEDGRILLANAAEGLQVVHPERGEMQAVDTHGVEVDRILPNFDGLRAWASTRDAGADARGTIVLQTKDCEWLVLDAEATTVRRVPVGCGFQLVRRIGEDAAIVRDWSTSRLLRVDLLTGAVTPLWPPASRD